MLQLLLLANAGLAAAGDRAGRLLDVAVAERVGDLLRLLVGQVDRTLEGEVARRLEEGASPGRGALEGVLVVLVHALHVEGGYDDAHCSGWEDLRRVE